MVYGDFELRQSDTGRICHTCRKRIGGGTLYFFQEDGHNGRFKSYRNWCILCGIPKIEEKITHYISMIKQFKFKGK